MLKIECMEKFVETLVFAYDNASAEAFLQRVKQLNDFSGEVTLYSDSAPFSFYFVWEINGKFFMNGGLIYSGPGIPSDGSAPSYTVSLDANASCGLDHMWSIHT